MNQIYLDYNANAPLYPEALEAMIRASSAVGSPSSVHCYGRDARKILEEARRSVANAVDAPLETLVFTSGASEANTMALSGYESEGCALWVSAVEHASVRNVSSTITFIPVDQNGIIKIDALTQMLEARDTAKRVVIAVMAANNETGVIQPILEVAALCKQFGAYFHCDAVQALGRLPLSFRELGADTLALSAHKVGGPIGIGALIIREGLSLPSLIKGAGQERGRRAGTQNVMLAAGFAAGLACALRENWGDVSVLRDYMEARLREMVLNFLIFAQGSPRLPNTSAFVMPGVKNEVQVMGFDLEGIAVSAGSACSSGTLKPSTVLTAMGIEDAVAQTAIRVSLTPKTTRTEIDTFLKTFHKIWMRSLDVSESSSRGSERKTTEAPVDAPFINPSILRTREFNHV
jgi:cysteine desulfurase